MLGLWLHRHSLVQKSQQGSRSVTATALAALPFHLLGQQIPRQTLMQSKVQTMSKEFLAPTRTWAGAFPEFWFSLGSRGFCLVLGF